MNRQPRYSVVCACTKNFGCRTGAHCSVNGYFTKAAVPCMCTLQSPRQQCTARDVHVTTPEELSALSYVASEPAIRFAVLPNLTASR
jgi:hypothetical protein